MRALVTSAAVPYVTLREVPAPLALSGQAIVRVQATSLNRGEVLALGDLPPSSRVGWDVAGVIAEPAADRTGPARGSRVVGLATAGAWAEFVAVHTDKLAEVPKGVSDVQAATLPTAGLTALNALRTAGLILGKRVLITGATGGVGRLAVQLANLSGADVSALIRDREQRPLMRELGASAVVDRISGEYDVIVDAAGGATFGCAIEHVAPRGIVVNLATQAADEIVSFRAGSFDRAQGARVYTLNLIDELGHHGDGARDLSLLVKLIAAGQLDAQVGYDTSWRQHADAFDALVRRRITGKIVLRID